MCREALWMRYPNRNCGGGCKHRQNLGKGRVDFYIYKVPRSQPAIGRAGRQDKGSKQAGMESESRLDIWSQ